MKTVLLDGRALTHASLAEAFGFPPYYGRNLDALFDCLGDIGEETAVVVVHFGEADEGGRQLLRVLADGVRENPRLRLFFAEEIL